MKVHILFKQKSKRSKEYVVDSLHTTNYGAEVRSFRVEEQEGKKTYLITKSLKGLVKVKASIGKKHRSIELPLV